MYNRSHLVSACRLIPLVAFNKTVCMTVSSHTQATEDILGFLCFYLGESYPTRCLFTSSVNGL